jgi:hypothetical protein
MLEDHKKLLYPSAEDGQKKLGTTLELLQWKAKNGISDKAFEKLLKIQKRCFRSLMNAHHYIRSKKDRLPFRMINREDACMS